MSCQIGVNTTGVYLAIDGDNIGRRLEELVASDDEASIGAFSNLVQTRIETFRQRVELANGAVLLCAGDSMLARVPESAAREIADSAVVSDHGLTFSAGMGATMSRAMLALKAAKAQGRSRCVSWDDL